MTMLEVLVGFGCLVAAAVGVLSLATFWRRRRIRKLRRAAWRRMYDDLGEGGA